MIKAAFLISFAVLFQGCAESEGEIRAKLDAVLNGDLAAMVAETRRKDTAAVLENPSYKISEYKVAGSRFTFDHKAVVDFHYLRGIRMKQVRKYRYNPSVGQWQRYYKELEYDLP